MSAQDTFSKLYEQDETNEQSSDAGSPGEDKTTAEAVWSLAELVVAYNKVLKMQGVGYFMRRKLVVAFQQSTMDMGKDD